MVVGLFLFFVTGQRAFSCSLWFRDWTFHVASVLSSVVITSLGGTGAGLLAHHLPVCPHLMVSRFSTPPLGARRLQSLIVVLPGDLIVFVYILSRLMTKPTKWHVRPVKTQISLGIRPVWSVFAVRMKTAWVLNYPLSAQQRIWSDWADAQAGLSLRWAHSHFIGFVMRQLILFLNCITAG